MSRDLMGVRKLSIWTFGKTVSWAEGTAFAKVLKNTPDDNMARIERVGGEEELREVTEVLIPLVLEGHCKNGSFARSERGSIQRISSWE